MGAGDRPVVGAGPYLQTPASRRECPFAEWKSAECRKSPNASDTMNFQAKTTTRTPSSLSHAFSTPVVRDLPSLSSVARGSAQTW
jgi:hypothetical protein